MECHGSPECLTQPPTCGPSAYAFGKHLGKKKYDAGQNGRENGGSVGDGGGVAKKGDVNEYQYYCFPVCNFCCDDNVAVGAR